MRLLNAKLLRFTPGKMKIILRFILKVYCSIPKMRFELIESSNHFQLKFVILKSRLSPIEDKWLRKHFKDFIDEHL